MAVPISTSERASREVALGRYWRAKEILSGRLRDSAYDPQLFEQYASVLQAMHDQDEAGRYYLLAGASEGDAGLLAKGFLARRKQLALDTLWHTMPLSARRLIAPLPEGTAALLAEAGYERARIEAHNANLTAAHREQQRWREEARSSGADRSVPLVEKGILISVAALFILVWVLGVVKLSEIVVGLIRAMP